MLNLYRRHPGESQIDKHIPYEKDDERNCVEEARERYFAFPFVQYREIADCIIERKIVTMPTLLTISARVITPVFGTSEDVT